LLLLAFPSEQEQDLADGRQSAGLAHQASRPGRDVDVDGEVMGWVYEFGPGDHYRIASIACLANRED